MHPTSDQRSFSRIDINSKVRYRRAGEPDFKEGTLDNVSASGVLLWTEEADIPAATRLLIVVEPEKDHELPIEITATVVRRVSAADAGRVGYGCQIEEITNA